MNYKNFKIVTKLSQIDKIISYCKKTGYCSFDFETSGTDYQFEEGYPTIVGISFQPGSAYIIPLNHPESPFKDNWESILQKVSDEIFKDKHIVKYAWNAKFEHKFLYKYLCDMKGRVFDVMLMKYLLNEERPNGLKDLVKLKLPEFEDYEDDAHALSKKHGWANIPLEPLSQYCAMDCDLTLRLGILLEPKLIENKFYMLFRNLLMMAHRFYAEGEYNGMHIDRAYLELIQGRFGEEIKDLEKMMLTHKVLRGYEKGAYKAHVDKLIEDTNEELEDIYSELDAAKEGGDPKKISGAQRKIKSREEKVSRYLAGEFNTKKEKWGGFNLGSPKQLIELFFESEHGFQWDVLDKTDSGLPSTGEPALLKKLDDLKENGGKKSHIKFIESLLELRGLSKLFSTYITGTLQKLTTKDTIHGRFLIHGTVTGRTSSQEPNLQNIPRMTTNKYIKPMFIPPKGYLVLEVDYSQAELRVVAELAKETNMIKWFNDGYNIHVATACNANGCIDRYVEIHKTILKDPSHPDNEFWEKQKKRAKLINFGILYGQTKYKLSDSLGCSPDEAQEFIESWYNDFPKIRTYIKREQNKAVKEGFVTSMWGRKRRLPDAQLDPNDWANKGFRSEALRQAVNAPIQGASNDFTLFSNVIIREEMIKGNLPWDLTFVASVHDALIFYIQPKDIHWCIPILKDICNNPKTKEWFGFQMKYVDMKVSAEVGKTWGGKSDYYEDINYQEWLKADDYPYHKDYLKQIE